METAALRSLTADACARLGGKLWPNRIGFDARRWEYMYVECCGSWQALYRPEGYGRGRHTKLGRGATPEEARANAREVEE